MLRRILRFLLPMAIAMTPTPAATFNTEPDPARAPIIIAHRGASAYLPEHTLAAKAMAHAMGADFLEQDVVLTRDGQAIVLHDLYLEGVTDVARRFPDRARADGRWYAIDFSLAEIRSLRLHERLDPATGQPVFPARFPPEADLFRIHTLEEELSLIHGLNRSTGRIAGIYVELKHPAWHIAEGQDPVPVLMRTLDRAGYRGPEDDIYIQCFEPDTLKRLHSENGTRIPLIQLIGESDWSPDLPVDFERMRTPEGLTAVAEYARGIGPWIGQIHQGLDDTGAHRTTRLVADAHAAGLLVHPYTLRRDALPEGFRDFEALLHFVLVDQRVDGVFTDHTDLAVRLRRAIIDSSR
ncbi:glycerophosphodiester phosphodiesterase [Thiocapsa sp.]|uniref:glycerophosphodiester phosphodiesterase n=1 Tax=Thiocapsa sp. TaxID=2024551 RepID=UPI002C143171|nr:glycerophosphodiester phosphodiesterase [Thiocapsa sp.]HSO82300.1 glycerophosphodiester phosphodiesterase [Thiocapsa sp.]